MSRKLKILDEVRQQKDAALEQLDKEKSKRIELANQFQQLNMTTASIRIKDQEEYEETQSKFK